MTNRVIKFRAWNRELQVMGSAHPLDVLAADIAERPEAYQRDWKNLDIMQFTGLHDKNGKEIYEGDVVEFEDERRSWQEVRWRDDWGSFELFKGKMWMGALWKYRSEVEVIGNIWENPELLAVNK